MLNSQDGTLINEDASFPTPPEQDSENEDIHQDQGEYIMARKLLHRNLSTDSSHQSSIMSFKRDYSTCSSQATVPISSDDDEVCDDISRMKTCQTVSDGSLDENDFRHRQTQSSQESQESDENASSSNSRRRQSTSSNSSGRSLEGKGPFSLNNVNGSFQNEMPSSNMETEKSSDTEELSSYSSHSPKLVVGKENIERESCKRLSVDANWEGFNPTEPKLVKFASIGSLQDYTKMYLRRTSSEGFQMPSEDVVN